MYLNLGNVVSSSLFSAFPLFFSMCSLFFRVCPIFTISSFLDVFPSSFIALFLFFYVLKKLASSQLLSVLVIRTRFEVEAA